MTRISTPGPRRRPRHWARRILLDLGHLAEEIDGVGASDRRAIRHQMVRPTKHRLTWDHQPARRTEIRRDSMSDAPLQIELILADSHSLVGYA
jgi:uncharacterized protein DUF29